MAQVRLFIVEKISTVNDVKPAPNDVVCLIVPDIKYVYKPLDRINTRTIIIGNESFSETVSIKLYQKYMTRYNLNYMVLIAKSESLESDIRVVINKINPDDIIRILP